MLSCNVSMPGHDMLNTVLGNVVAKNYIFIQKVFDHDGEPNKNTLI